MPSNKITVTELKQFMDEYYKNPKRKEIRFGQAFLNKFLPEVNNSELFYQTDNTTALMLIYRDYVKYE